MNKTLIYTYIIFASITLVSCEPEAVDVAEAPEFEQKIVGYCYLHPGDSVNYAIVRYNIPRYGEIIREAFTNENNKVVISDGTNEQEFIMQCDTIVVNDTLIHLVEDTFFLDTKSFPIAEGKEYTLTITDYKQNRIDAKCTVPVKRNLNIQWDTARYIKHFEYGDESVLQATISFTDYANEPNFYHIVSNLITYDGSNVNFNFFSNKICNDYLLDGKMIKSNFDIPAYYLNFGGDSTFLQISILQTDKNYYEFYKSLYNYSFSEDPFTEVTHLYSNIKGGLGIFCGYTRHEFKIKLK